MRKTCCFPAAVLLAFLFAGMLLSGCSFARDLTYIKQTTFGVDNVETQKEVEEGIKIKHKKRKINGVKVTQNVIYAPVIGYASISKEERLKYSDKTDKKYGLFRYRFYYDYGIPEEILLFIDVDSEFYFVSAFDQSGEEFKLTPNWPKNHLFNDLTTYRELYTIYFPIKYVEAKQDEGIVIDVLSKNEGHTNNFALALYTKASNLSRTFHISPFYIKGFLSAIEKFKPIVKEGK